MPARAGVERRGLPSGVPGQPCYSLGTMADPAPLLPAYLILGTDRPKVRRAVSRLRQRVIDEAAATSTW